MTLSLKALVRSRAMNCCEYCLSQERFSADTFSIEHIVPISKGGISDEQNLALSCQGCNNFKYISTQAIDPATGENAPLFNPSRRASTSVIDSESDNGSQKRHRF